MLCEIYDLHNLCHTLQNAWLQHLVQSDRTLDSLKVSEGIDFLLPSPVSVLPGPLEVWHIPIQPVKLCRNGCSDVLFSKQISMGRSAGDVSFRLTVKTLAEHR